MQQNVVMQDGIELIEIRGKFEEVCDFVDKNREDHTVLFFGNFSYGGEAVLTKEPLEETVKTQHGSQCYTMRGKAAVIKARIKAIQRNYDPRGYGGHATEAKDIGSGLVEVVYSHSSCCD